MKILGGAHQPDLGEMKIDGQSMVFHSPQESRAAGIAVIYQEFNLIPALTASENIFLGQEKTQSGLLLQREEQSKAQELFQRLGIQIPLHQPVRELTTAQQQAVEIAKALSQSARIIVMDEPTQPSRRMKQISYSRSSMNYVRQALGLSISVIVLRRSNGSLIESRFCETDKNVGSWGVKEITREKLIEQMVGRKLENEYPVRQPKLGAVKN